jgi:hypothetical protein
VVASLLASQNRDPGDLAKHQIPRGGRDVPVVALPETTGPGPSAPPSPSDATTIVVGNDREETGPRDRQRGRNVTHDYH